MDRACSIWRMMSREQQRAFVLILIDPFQRRLDEIELRVADISIGDDSRVFESIGVQGNNAYKRRLESEKYARLNLRRS